jgi:diguanylate cyclase (GGDEF)-like protein/PAS domain S-box-containing protein
MPTSAGSPEAGGGPPAERALARTLELIAAGAPLDSVLAELAAAVERGCEGLSASVSLPDDGDGAQLLSGAPATDSAQVRVSTSIRSAAGAPLGTLTVVGARARSLSNRECELVAAAAQIAALAIEHVQLRETEAGYRALVERLPTVVYIADAGVTGRWHYVSPQIQSMLGFAREDFLSDPYLWVNQLHAGDRDRVVADETSAELDADPRTSALNPTASEYRMHRRDGGVVWIRDDALMAHDDRGRLRWYGVLSDITVRKQAEAEVERRAAQQASVARLGEHALEGADLAELMHEAVGEATRILDVEIGSVFELMPDGDALLLRSGLGWGEIGKTRLPTGKRSQSGFTLQAGGPVVVTDWASEQRFDKPQAMRGQKTRSGLTVVIEGLEGPFGVLGVQSKELRDYSAGDIDFVQSLANVLADAIQRQTTEDDIRHRALHDSLTGLPNRVLFLDRLGHALASARRRRSGVAVLFLDLDHFKLVNDSLGHQAGDELLVAVAPRLTQAVRPSDTVARFGGDEFGILLEELSSERDAAEVAERIAANFARPFVLGANEHFVTASIGIAVADNGDVLPETLIRDADSAMYRAKERGRARYELFDEVMRARAVARLRVENDLRRAIERRELRLEYQPMVSLSDGSIVGVEALVRWQHPERGLVAPGEFIPVAEECGLIEPIGRWVLEEALRQAGQWHGASPDAAPVGISVNLSARQVAQQDLPAGVERLLHATGVDPGCLSLEITETVVLDEAELLGDTLRALRAMGVRLVLDDFGTGYSSLGYLHRLPLDALKVDRSFIDGLGTEPRDSAIVKAVVGMAQALSLGVIAEGVETEVQLAELRRLGCDQAQGFFFAPSVSAPQIAAMLRERTPFRAALSGLATT